ncbi:hypothetical protein QJ48_04895 [Paenibacillus sp. A3]|nr:hypothetical protein QJ48_04895 [Paenibacillus sp. A3]
MRKFTSFGDFMTIIAHMFAFVYKIDMLIHLPLIEEGVFSALTINTINNEIYLRSLIVSSFLGLTLQI